MKDTKSEGNIQEMIEYHKKIKIPKTEYRRMFRLGESIKAYYESANSYLQDAEMLFEKKRYRACVLCCQLGLEEMGMAFRISDLIFYTNQEALFNKYFFKIVERHKNHKFKVGGITQFRFRHSSHREEFSKMVAEFLHVKRIKETYVSYDEKKKFFNSSPQVTKIEAYNDLKIAKHYISIWGSVTPSIIENLRRTVNLFGVRKE